ncbi:hypothetical protein SSP24_63380 [Streptomyces spinoverrucosus]|uniref:Uncharacterized protein n=1 Tax=Streptomyces spinoverrucosus TaxID=284043 RepID=A0A4Y3VQ04_9ACTN|nr:hypothetical protein [Streptomyces spinoverrucosus]GEC08683.1 hypothetical protein SSP24_63380 [Streptomyces spinoverrucosus]GHB53679.1 hypothetical protein GCM10010397_24720 [Streptomyces spinoverrucosus]
MTGTDSDLMARLPPIKEPSKTEQFAQDARRDRPADEHWTSTRVFPYVDLLRDRDDSPLYLGVSGRPAILLRLSGRMRADLDGLGELIRDKGADLFLQGHRLGRYGMVRAVLQLPEYDLIFETPLTLAHGDVQEFIAAAYQDEAVELHLAHAHDARSLGFACRAAGIQPVVDAVLDAVRGLRHPTTPAEQAAPVAALEARFPQISDGLSDGTRIRLSVTGRADGVMTMVTRN